jgi:hypothetical protein
MNHYENKILSCDSDIETLQTHIKELQKQKLQDELENIKSSTEPNMKVMTTAVMILTQLGMEETRANKQVAEGALYLYSVCAKITDTSVIEIAKHCPGLTEMYLDACFNITDTSVIALAENCPGLREIGLGACFNITDTSITALVEHCPGMTTIHLRGCSNITDTAKQLLREYLFSDSGGGCWKRAKKDCYISDN